MSINGVNNSGVNDIYSTMFGTTSSSGSSNILGDYSMIKSGVYKKLLKAYYAQDKDSTGKTEETEEDKTVSAAMLSTRTNAQELTSAMEKLSSKSLYEAKEDENGNLTVDREGIQKAVKSFVNSYNSFIEKADDVDSKEILRKASNMVKATSTNASLLSDIGIKIGEGNKLTLDEEKLGKADVTTLDSLFRGSGSYGNRVQYLAAGSYKVANSQVYSRSNASSYTFDGQYSILGTKNGALDEYL